MSPAVGVLALCVDEQLKKKQETINITIGTPTRLLEFIIFIIFLFETEHKYYTFLFK
jgi:hypothetical protein